MNGLIKEQDIENKKAKSSGITIYEHNEELKKNLEKIKNIIGSYYENQLFENLEKTIKYHDFGKANIRFQEKIDNKSNREEILFHHLISPLFYIISKNSNLDDNDIIIIHAIMNHHSRQLELLKSVKEDLFNNSLRDKLKKVYEDIEQFVDVKDLNIDKFVNKYLDCIIRSAKLQKNSRKKDLIIITGLLIRLDHAASGGLDVEEEPIKEDREKILYSYLEKNNKIARFRPFQEKFGIKEKKDYQAIVADTGLGKTGLSVLWSQRKKFYILPNRASVNAMYKTLGEVYGEDKVGLLHSTALYNILDDNKDNDFSILREYDQTRVLSKPVTVCTADQLFTAAFNMPGYEKIYATLSYSDVVIDEIQGFQPQQIIPILKQIKETKELGAKYLIMTATLPDIVTIKLKDIGFEIIEDAPETFDNIKRHKIKIEDKKIEDIIDEIISKYENNKKVLVVNNTVKKSQEVYEELKKRLQQENQKNINLNLLHSRFIWRDRQDKEGAILKACEQDENGNYKDKKGCIWVCTQLVEASLDIDFDYLFTEAATIDSLIQRMGRIWRHRKTDYIGDENIIIASNVEHRIYEQVLVKKTLEMINEKIQKQNKFLISFDKRSIVKELYNKENLKNLDSKYLEDWENYERMINSGWDFILEENAQKAFRDVMTIELIPFEFKTKVEEILNELQNELNKIDQLQDLSKEDRKKQKRIKRVKKLKEIQEYKVPVPIYLVNQKISKKIIDAEVPIEWINRDYNIGILHKNYKYDYEIGLTGKVIEEEEKFDNII